MNMDRYLTIGCTFTLLATTFLLATPTPLAADPTGTRPVEGLREYRPAVFALLEARVVVDPDRTLESATIVVRDGVIEAVGVDIEVPADAVRLKMTGRTVYPGLIDAFGEQSASFQNRGASHWNPHVTPQRSLAAVDQPNASRNSRLGRQGLPAPLAAPPAGIDTLATCTSARGCCCG
jgi:hypothetical protein